MTWRDWREITSASKPLIVSLWLTLRSKRLPRPLSGIAICVVYHPPGRPAESHKELNDYLINTTDRLRNEHPDHGLVLPSDFNDFDCSNLVSHHSLKQVLQQPTRNSAILDLIVTNLHNLYSSPTIHALLGSSDHNIVFWQPSLAHRQSPLVNPPKRLVRHYPRSGIDAFGRWVTTHDWFTDLGPSPSVDDLVSSFITQLIDAIDRILPVKTIKLHGTDKPWITPELKLMIKDWQKAFHNGNIPVWCSLKYKIQQEIAKRKKSFYKSKVKYLKKDDCHKWWNIINQMSGRSAKPSFFLLERDGKIMCQQELVNSLNQFYVSVHADIPPLDGNILLAFLPAEAGFHSVQPHEVFKKLLAIKPPRPTIQTTYLVASLKSSHTNWLNLSPPSLTHHFDLVLYQ